MKRRYSLSALGGTFDRLHTGHQLLITTAAAQSQALIIGITSDEMVAKSKSHSGQIQSLGERKSNLDTFCSTLHTPYSLVILDDTSGPAATDPRISALFFTKEVAQNAININILRNNNGIPVLSLIEVPILLTKENEKISSESIRNGSIDRSGNPWFSIPNKPISLSLKQRQRLQQPLGPLLQNIPQDKNQRAIVVGDSTLEKFLENHWQFTMAVIDGKKSREKYYPLVIKPNMIDLILLNPPGQITPMLCKGLQIALKHSYTYIYVEGEEDLAALVLMLVAPLNWILYYGQPSEGIVQWQVSEANKEVAKNILLEPSYDSD